MVDYKDKNQLVDSLVSCIIFIIVSSQKPDFKRHFKAAANRNIPQTFS